MQNKKGTGSATRSLVEASLMVAVGAVLSFFPIVELPYGGSVTLASMLPVILVSFRTGWGFGVLSGFSFAAIELLLGARNLSFVTGWQSVVAVILLDYLLAFASLAFGALFRKSRLPEEWALTLAVVFCSFLRYLCHTAAGATVWAGLSIPTEAALLYSLGYNATYMLPETIVTAVAAYYLSSRIDLRSPTLKKRKPDENATRVGASLPVIVLLSDLSLCVALIFDAAWILPVLQSGEDGRFSFDGLTRANFIPVIAVSAVALCCLLLRVSANIYLHKKHHRDG